ncbi:hypothetical protein [Minwuia sp.]|uniref:hypothetical protein n=1 Tax=Minwuia sp. TaxID=2493630 RepID=UPI003A95D61A
MEQPATKRWNKRMVLMVANGDERQVDRTLMAAWSVRQRHPDAPIGIVTDKPTHRMWRTGLFNVVVSSADHPDATTAECVKMAMKREVFDRAVVFDSFCRLRAESILPVMELLKQSPVCFPARKTDEGVRISGRLLALQRSEEALLFLDALADAQRQTPEDPTGALNRVISGGSLKDIVKFGALGGDWLPAVAASPDALPSVELRQGDVQRLYAEMLMFAMHRLVSSDLKRAATIYARVAITTNPDLPQLGAERLVAHMAEAFDEKVAGLSDRNRDQLRALLQHAACEDPAGNLLGIAALHLDVGQVKTAVAVLRMIYKMKFNKPVPVPG